MKSNFVIAGFVLIVLGLPGYAQDSKSTLTFLNATGRDAFVKLAGPNRVFLDVPNGGSAKTTVRAGVYSFVVSLCDSKSPCVYAKGDSFAVEESLTEYSVIEITLHGVVNGNYQERPINRDEFEKY